MNQFLCRQVLAAALSEFLDSLYHLGRRACGVSTVSLLETIPWELRATLLPCYTDASPSLFFGRWSLTTIVCSEIDGCPWHIDSGPQAE